MLKSLIERAVSFSARRYPIVLATTLLLLLTAGSFASAHFVMTTDSGVLISPETQWRRNDAEVTKAFPQLNDTIVVVIDGKTPELAKDAADKLSAALGSDRRNFALVRRPDGGAFFDREGLLFGSLDDVRDATTKLVEAQPLLGGLAYDPSLRGIANTLATAASGVADGTDDASADRLEQPLVKLDQALRPMLAGKTAYFSWQQLFAAGKGDLVPATRQVILAQPRLRFDDLQPGEGAVAMVLDQAAKLKLDAAHGIGIGITGEIPLADEEFGSIKENIGVVGALMAVAMLVTLWFATRSAKVVLAIVATIVSGLVLTLATGLAVVGRFNLISVAFIPLFVGLGVDFGIQMSVRFNAERRSGTTNLTEALERAAQALGGPILLAAGAICLALGAFLPTDYVGVAELGIISGLGMLIALVLNMTLLPAMLLLLKPAVPRSDLGLARAPAIDRWLARNRRAVLVAFAVAMLASIATLPLVRFDFNLLHLRDPDAPAMRMLQNLMHDPRRTPNTLSVLAPDAAAADRLAQRLAKLPEVRDAITVDSFVPAEQPAKLALIQDASLLLDATLNPFDLPPAADDASTVASLSKAAAELHRLAAARPGPLGSAATRLAADFEQLAQATPSSRLKAQTMLVEPLTVTLNQLRLTLQASEISRETLPPEVASDWLARDGRALVQLVPAGDSADNAVIARFTSAVRGVAPNAVGLPVAAQEAARTVSRAFVQAGLLALILVCLLLYAVLRSLREVAFTMAPVVLSGFLTLGSCVVIGQPLNFANIIAFPLLFGVGVAFHIYFVMAWRSGASDLLQTSLAWAVMFSALATGSAFGALWFSDHPGTASMGLILMISLIWTLVCALVFEPALLGPQRPVSPGSRDRNPIRVTKRAELGGGADRCWIFSNFPQERL
ncbi:MMPL family transporter [Novosphingobium sp. G106]|uniref:MMPL family transporter n=1 Tax=Novosphingobium sp. G106 TaxID=2849500 RepID=UPI001C2D5D01|nr:MMPL family transporter [Novosphingobium sp. G106]MBV1688642.1 MMPL family transporter [Novosphingobium sp. G106]